MTASAPIDLTRPVFLVLHTPVSLPCDHAGLLLLAPAMTEAGLHELISGCGYPATSRLSSWHSIGTLPLAAANRVGRAHHIDKITDDAGLAFFLGLTALPKATHLSTYSYRVRRSSSRKLLTGLIRRLRDLGLATGEKGFNCDFHAIRHGDDHPVLIDAGYADLELPYPPVGWAALRYRFPPR